MNMESIFPWLDTEFSQVVCFGQWALTLYSYNIAYQKAAIQCITLYSYFKKRFENLLHIPLIRLATTVRSCLDESLWRVWTINRTKFSHPIILAKPTQDQPSASWSRVMWVDPGKIKTVIWSTSQPPQTRGHVNKASCNLRPAQTRRTLQPCQISIHIAWGLVGNVMKHDFSHNNWHDVLVYNMGLPKSGQMLTKLLTG